MEEQWKAIVIEKNGVIYDFTGKYEVSNLGRVRSLNYKHTGKIKLLKQSKTKEGYLQVQLYKNGKCEKFYTHRIIATMFISNPDNLAEVNHKDFDRTNNKIENIEWVSREENIQHSYNSDKQRADERRCKLSEAKKGSKHPRAKKVMCVETGQVFDTIKEASELLGISYTNISDCCRDKQKTCGGYHWRYI